MTWVICGMLGRKGLCCLRSSGQCVADVACGGLDRGCELIRRERLSSWRYLSQLLQVALRRWPHSSFGVWVRRVRTGALRYWKNLPVVYRYSGVSVRSIPYGDAVRRILPPMRGGDSALNAGASLVAPAVASSQLLKWPAFLVVLGFATVVARMHELVPGARYIRPVILVVLALVFATASRRGGQRVSLVPSTDPEPVNENETGGLKV